jgi:hypothetical protein
VDDILIHPRDRDLIVATHGRSIYIADDITALEQLKTPMKQDLVLFAPRPAIQWKNDPQAQRHATNRDFIGRNPQGGTAINIWAKSDMGAGKLEFLQGNTVASTMDVDIKAGMNRVQWAMRGPAPPVPQGGQQGGGQGGAAAAGGDTAAGGGQAAQGGQGGRGGGGGRGRRNQGGQAAGAQGGGAAGAQATPPAGGTAEAAGGQAAQAQGGPGGGGGGGRGGRGGFGGVPFVTGGGGGGGGFGGFGGGGGALVQPGVYFVRLTVGGQTLTQSVTVLEDIWMRPQ